MFNVVSSDVYFVIVVSKIHGRKMGFSESCQNPIYEKSIFVHFGVIFLNVSFFPGRRWFFPVSIIKEEYFNEKMSSLAGLKKKLLNFPQKYRFWPFLTTWVYLQSPFSHRADKISKILGEFRNIVLKFELSIFKKVRG